MYFDKFPIIPYDSVGDLQFKDVTNLLRRVGLRAKLKSNTALFDTYSVKEGETPEMIAHKLYGDSNLHFVIMLLNDITDRYHQWPMSFIQFNQYLNDKYSNPDGIHHYEVTTSSGKTTGDGPDDYSHKIEVNSDASGAQSVSNREFEQRLQDKKRKIKLLNEQYLSTFIDEFNTLVRK